MESLSEGDKGRVGLSVEGKILERDPLNPAVIKKCQISAVALTMNPVNTDTFADIVKSMNASEGLEISSEEQTDLAQEEAVFTASQVMAIVQKALSIGATATEAPAAKTGGAALQPSGMAADEDKKKKKIEKGEEDADGSVFSSKPSEIIKGGPGSGVKGHRTQNESAHPKGSAKYAEDHAKFFKEHDDKAYKHRYARETLPISGAQHHEAEAQHHEERAAYHLGEAEGSKKKIKKMSKSLYKSNLIAVLEKLQVLYPHNSRSEIWEAVKERLDTKFEKGLRIHNTSGKEREHKLYEDARQRGDYEANKDKSRGELNELAEQSGASKHDKQKIRAQADAAKQVGDRDHVRPGIAS